MVGEVRQHGRAILGHDRERLDRAGIDLRLGGRDDLAQEVDAAGDQILHRRAGALVGNMGDVGAHRGVEHHAAEMRGGARAGRAELHLGLVGLGVGDEFLEVLDRQVLAHQERDRNLGDQRHRREVGHRVVERLLVERLALRLGADGAEQHGVAVGPGVGHAPAAGLAAGAADVLDDHVLAEHFAHARRHDAAEHVGRAAGGEGDDHGQRMGRIVLRRGRTGEREKAGQRRHECSFH